MNNSRRNFFKQTGAVLATSTLPFSLVAFSLAKTEESFSFAYISDHIFNTSKAHNLFAIGIGD